MNINCVRTSLSAVSFALLAGAAWGADDLPRVSAAERNEPIVACKLPTQVRKMSSSRVIALPGRVQQLTIAQCAKQGGRYEARLVSESTSTATKTDADEAYRPE